MIIFVIYFYLNNKKHKFKVLLVSGGLIASIIAVIFTLSHSLFDRLAIITAGNDGSSNFRLIGSWNSLMTLLANNPLIGYGLGDDNKWHYYESLSSKSFHGITINGVEILDMHNMLFQIICNLGVLGGVLFLLLLHGLSFKRSLIIITGIGLTYFTVNVFNNFFFFTIISIATYYWGVHKVRLNRNTIILK
ncbi:O-antigen ligase family protein [uncultured Duncaniella sp.]|uniref:O-antigen ligase family protein n=1 Tax=uncultured Duncaniella sp. TaxID=2768039 RepID=UPI00351CEEE6